MTTSDRTTPGAVRARTLRDDLLDDLRQAAPMPTAPPMRDVSIELSPVRVVSVREPVDPPAPAGPETPTIDVRVTPLQWWRPRITTLDDGSGLVVGVGPVQVYLAGFRR